MSTFNVYSVLRNAYEFARQSCIHRRINELRLASLLDCIGVFLEFYSAYTKLGYPSFSGFVGLL